MLDYLLRFKGKGTMETYWLTGVGRSTVDSFISSRNDPSNADGSSVSTEDMYNSTADIPGTLKEER